MIKNVDLSKCKNLTEFYNTLYEAHESHQGTGYCDHHKTMEAYLSGCNSYREFGVLQGATVAKAALCGVKYIQAVDVQLHRFSPYVKLFEGIEVELHESSTVPHPVEFKGKMYEMTDGVKHLKPVDFMFIDDIHEHDHVLEELTLHSPTVNKYILMHDTYLLENKVNESLHKAALKFIEQNSEWTIERRSKVSTGHTLLKRI